MMGLKRRPVAGGVLEPWLEWHKRSMREARMLAQSPCVSILDKLTELKHKWAGHIAHFGMNGRPIHSLKFFLMWRPRAWWFEQDMYNSLQWDQLRHPKPGKPIRWESQFPRDWMYQYNQSHS